MVECGKGSFGVVYRATYRHSEVAVKSINETAFGDDTDIVTEAHTLAALPTHNNVVAFRGHCRLKSGRPAIVLEFCEGGSLLAALRSKDVQWTLEKQLKVASGTAAGVAHLHKCGIVHRDIAARNVLLASLDSMVAKVTDFGMSKAQAEADSTLSSFGAAAWMGARAAAKHTSRRQVHVLDGVGRVCVWRAAV
jgi:serine/threonine protein kinase